MHYLQRNKRRLGKMLKERLAYYKQGLHFISGPSRMRCKEIIGEIMRACVIMHNMIVEDERDSYIRQFDYTDNDVNFNIVRPEIFRNRLPSYEMYLRSHAKIRNRSINQKLQADLIEEIWN
ncbi:uncharacterized protein LOC111883808 [Lactuca sativa]|uniref:uncharacterized protein LOC111883808 n=1 Tax=Lactuca sativa TaxID=4236 RepID=UPI000CD817AA|nr:uncharacterized protein LOC111883808 [Lactuca sativa]